VQPAQAHGSTLPQGVGCERHRPARGSASLYVSALNHALPGEARLLPVLQVDDVALLHLQRAGQGLGVVGAGHTLLAITSV
jgi:hypothetical protein